ncbi:MAG: DUF4159 domain-containing protein [Elusimicrobia bacterium]|nr:DUF4159 domain-containing protein [Elusimicrobiota bacterium]
MNFLNPLALWALPAAGVPALIHLLSRRAARRVRFSDLTLLSAVEARLRPRARLRELILLAARTMLALALVLAAAGPVARGAAAAGRGEGLDLVLLLDASYSTRALDAGRARFERAREAGRRLLKKLSPGDRVAVAAFDERVLTPLAWSDATAADAQLGRAAAGWRGTDAAGALVAARDLLSRSPKGRRRAVVVLGDGAAHMLSSPAPAPADGTVVLGLRFPATANEWISDAGPAPGSSARAPRLEVRVSASGAAPETGLDAWVGARRAGSTHASAPRGDEARATLALPAAQDPRAPAWSGRVAARPDALSDDDVAYFSFRHRPAPRVLVLVADPEAERAGRAAWFLRRLFGGGEGSMAGREADFLAASRWREADLSIYGTVILPDARALPAGLSAALERFAALGGGVLVLPGADARAEELAALSAWLPARFGAAEASPPPGLAAVAGSETTGWSGYELGRVQFSRRWRLEPAAGARVLLSGGDGAPLLAAGPVGRGRAAVWAAPLDADSSNLGLKPVFPAWARLCLSATLPAEPDAEALQSWTGRSLVRVWREDEPAPDRVIVREPDGRRVPLIVRARRAVLPSADAPGLYAFEEPDGTTETFAVNLDARRGESDLTPASLPPWIAVEPDGLDAAFLSAVYGVDERGLCLALAALALAAEMLLSIPARAQGAPRREAPRGARAAALGALALAAILAAPARAQQGDRFVWTQLRLGPDWDPYPDAPDRAVRFLGQVTSVRVAAQRRVIALDDAALFSSPFLYLSGGGAPPDLSDAELRRLRQYLAGGGFLWIEDATGGPRAAFDRWARRTVALLLPGAPLKDLPDDHVIERTFFLLRGPVGCADASEPLEGATLGDRVAVLYSRGNVLAAWAQDALGRPLETCGGEWRRQLAERLTLNVVMYSLTGSYKSDAVHQELILRKLREAGP